MSLGMPFLKGWLYVPNGYFYPSQQQKQLLTVESNFKQDMQGNIIPPIEAFDIDSYPGFTGLPMRYGLDLIKSRSAMFKDLTSVGSYRIDPIKQPDLNHEKAHADQKYICPELLNKLREHRSVMLEAPVGSGKTPMALWLVAETKLKTIIFVDRENLKRQWINEIIDKLGYAKEDIGIIQADICQTDKPITICMIKTVYTGKFQDQLLNQFGLAIFDEVHTLGAPKLFGILGRINPWCMLAMSATIHRRDGRDKAYKFFFGQCDTKAEAPALPIKVNVLPYTASNWGTTLTSKILCVSRDVNFAKKVAEVVYKLYLDNRNILVVANHKKQLVNIYGELVKFGAPPEVCGHLYGDGSKLHTCAKLKDTEYFQLVMQSSNIIFSTIGMVEKGVSIARLDALVDATPRAEDQQLLGRTRRPHENKRLPVAYVFNHLHDRAFRNMTERKIRKYLQDKSLELVRYDQGL